MKPNLLLLGVKNFTKYFENIFVFFFYFAGSGNLFVSPNILKIIEWNKKHDYASQTWNAISLSLSPDICSAFSFFQS